ncbi:MAG: ATP-binding cassette domain-containing protein [Gammaproteobacteria bacterium]|jgi:ABC-2 type transport system ATP-binding protein
MTDIVIKCNQLRFAYKEQLVLSDIDLSVYAGEIFGLVGADGAGKSTLLHLAVGQSLPTTGSITILGKKADDPLLRDDIAYMPQGFGLYPDLSVQENLEFFADLHGLAATKAQQRIADLLQRTGLAGFEQRRGGNLSGGMMQKLALACALVHEPKVMFLDEPTTGVDPLSRRAFWRLIDGVKAEGVAILYATANMDEAERCDRVGMLEAGTLTRQGPPLQLIRKDNIRFIAVFGENVRRYRHQIKTLPGVKFAFPIGLRLNVWLDATQSMQDFQQALRSLSGDFTAKTQQPSLHDATLYDLAKAEQDDDHAGV